MQRTNPLYVMRNYLAQLAIDEAEQGRSEATEQLLDVMRRPYESQEGMEKYSAKRPEWARHRPGARCCLVVPKPRVLSLGPSNPIQRTHPHRPAPSACALNALRNRKVLPARVLYFAHVFLSRLVWTTEGFQGEGLDRPPNGGKWVDPD